MEQGLFGCNLRAGGGGQIKSHHITSQRSNLSCIHSIPTYVIFYSNYQLSVLLFCRRKGRFPYPHSHWWMYSLWKSLAALAISAIDCCMGGWNIDYLAYAWSTLVQPDVNTCYSDVNGRAFGFTICKILHDAPGGRHSIEKNTSELWAYMASVSFRHD